MEEKKFAEKLLASLGGRSSEFVDSVSKALSQVDKQPRIEIVDAPKVAIDKEDYEIMAVSWKDLGVSEEREAIREIIKTELLWKTQDDGFIGALEWMLGELNARDAKDAAEQGEQ